MMIVPWNLTRHVIPKRNADVIVISPAKAGRTWLRVMLNKYLSLQYDVPFSLDDLHRQSATIPSIVYEHWLWFHLRLATPVQRLRGRYIIPASILSRKKLIMLVRDPRDIIISAYFQESTREQKHKKTDLPISEFVRDRKRGIASVVRVLNLTYRKIRNCPSYMMLKYEDMRADPAAELARVVRFIGVPLNKDELAEAVSFAAFDNMRKMEKTDAARSAKLRPADPENPESYKVRKGKVGGFVDYLEDRDIAYINEQLRKLDPGLGYSTP
jgi:hypothetical protein